MGVQGVNVRLRHSETGCQQSGRRTNVPAIFRTSTADKAHGSMQTGRCLVAPKMGRIYDLDRMLLSDIEYLGPVKPNYSGVEFEETAWGSKTRFVPNMIVVVCRRCNKKFAAGRA